MSEFADTAPTRRRFLRQGLAAAAGSAAVLGGYAWQVEPFWVEIVRRRLPLEGLPASLEGARLVQVSDLHVGPRVDSGFLIDALGRIAGLAPDLVVITGDLITYRGPRELDELVRVMQHLPPGRLATLASLGNHDFGQGWSQREVAEAVGTRLGTLGIRVLRNEALDVGGLTVLGVDDLWSPSFEPHRALRDIVRSHPTLALCHNPDVADEPVWRGLRGWILAGHTHGGQCRPPFLPPPILPVRNKRYTSGEFDLGEGRWMYVNRGLGYLLPVRFNVRPEITLFELARA